MITEYGNLESVYNHIEDISGKKLKERLVENKDLAFLSRELATIKTDMDLSYKVEDLYKISIPLRYSLYSKPWDLLN